MNQSGSRIRSSPLTNDTDVEFEYHRTGLALSIFSAFCFFCSLWLLNGYFTARTVVVLGNLFGFVALSWGTGWLVHVVVSLVEHHLWRLRTTLTRAPGAVYVGIYTLIIVVGVLDVFTSSLAFLLLFASTGFSVFSLTAIIISTVLAEVIAILPETVIVWLIIGLWRVITAK